MNPSKRKGTAAETAVVEYLRGHGFAHAERRALHGSLDQGDVTGIPGICVEVKNCATYDLPGWMRETEAERWAAGADVGALVVKPRGVGATRVGEWWAVLTLDQLAYLLRAAGYGQPLEPLVPPVPGE
jgi:hypothetical protein